jgi:selenocysteine lyase/cysteine desulfurase
MKDVASAVMARADEIDRGVRGLGYEVMLERTPANGSGIVSFRHPRLECDQIANELRRQKIFVATRQGWLRASPHFYISPDDIDCLLRALPKSLGI